jgi:hypothetical protein
MQNSDVEDLNFKEVHNAILAQWESEQNWNKGKFNNNSQHVNKLSAVKYKHGDPHFSQQQGNRQNNNNQNQNNDNCQYGNHGKGKGKGKNHQDVMISTCTLRMWPLSLPSCPLQSSKLPLKG